MCSHSGGTPAYIELDNCHRRYQAVPPTPRKTSKRWYGLPRRRRRRRRRVSACPCLPSLFPARIIRVPDPPPIVCAGLDRNAFSNGMKKIYRVASDKLAHRGRRSKMQIQQSHQRYGKFTDYNPDDYNDRRSGTW